MTDIELIIEKKPGHPDKWRAWLGDELLVEHRAPICAAARVLDARGMGDCRVAVRHRTGILAFPATPVAVWAKTAVSEPDLTRGPRFTKFKPFAGLRDAEDGDASPAA